MIDLRSDTVTKLTAGMRQAEVGDDVYGEDPTVRRLEECVADLLDKEAGLFVPSGVVANQLGIKVHTRPGDEVIVERQSHIYNYENGAPALLCGVQLNVVDGTDGLLTAAQVAAAVRPGHYWEPQPALVCLENTVNKAGGVVYSLARIREIAQVAAAPVVEALREAGVLLSAFGPQTIRATTHRDVSMDDIDAALAAFRQHYG